MKHKSGIMIAAKTGEQTGYHLAQHLSRVVLNELPESKFADMIMVERDPLKDITVMSEVSWVMKEGMVIPLYPEWARKPINAPLW